MIVDAQLHDPTVRLEWAGADQATRRALLTELQLGYMRAVGVDRAILFPVDLDWGQQAAEQLPDTFVVVPMIIPGGLQAGLDPSAADIARRIADKFAEPGVAGFRAMIVIATRTNRVGLPSPTAHPLDRFRDGVFDAVFAACEERQIPLFVSVTGHLEAAAEIARRYPDLRLIVDHLGIPQPPSFLPDSPPLQAVPDLLALAEHPNIHVKVTGTPTLSREKYPFADLWASLRRIVDAFGAERLLWGSDISRVNGRMGFDVDVGGGPDDPYEGRHVYAESVLAFRETDALSDAEKRLMMGETACRLLDWPQRRGALNAPGNSAVRQASES